MGLFTKLQDSLNIGNRMPKLDNITPSVPNGTSSNASVQHLKYDERDMESEDSLWGLYEKWCSHYKVSRSLDEKHKRFSTFKHHAQYIHNYNKINKSCWLNLNQFSDMTLEEFMETSGCNSMQKILGYANVNSDPASAVTDVKNQGQCGSLGMSRTKERAKRDAWKAVEGKSEEEAVGDYITKMKHLLEEGGVAA